MAVFPSRAAHRVFVFEAPVFVTNDEPEHKSPAKMRKPRLSRFAVNSA
jgi:hypothetical protein